MCWSAVLRQRKNSPAFSLFIFVRTGEVGTVLPATQAVEYHFYPSWSNTNTMDIISKGLEYSGVSGVVEDKV